MAAFFYAGDLTFLYVSIIVCLSSKVEQFANKFTRYTRHIHIMYCITLQSAYGIVIYIILRYAFQCCRGSRARVSSRVCVCVCVVE